MTFLLACVLHGASSGQTEEQLIELTKKAFDDAKLIMKGHPRLAYKESLARSFQNSFKGIGAEKRTLALAHYLYDIDANYPEWAMRTSITAAPMDVLGAAPRFIDDWSYLRTMLANEKDPRKFYLLSKLTSMAKPPNDDFVAARAHMLFADGSVAKDEGEYTVPYYNDVSLYAYVIIVENLRKLGADFRVPPEDIPHKEKAVILAKWLNKNWAGCENIEIPAHPIDAISSLGKAPAVKPSPAQSQHHQGTQSQSVIVDPESTQSRLPWLIAGLLLVGIVALLAKMLKRRFTS